MRLYHYAPKENTILREGIKSISKIDSNLHSYVKRVGSDKKEDIINWLEKTFKGRSCAISCLTEPIVWQGNDKVLKALVDRSILYSFELEGLINAGLVESIWCKDGSEASGINEHFYQVTKEEIDLSPLPWHKCDSSKGLIFGVIKHYLLVLKDGVIPPEFIKGER